MLTTVDNFAVKNKLEWGCDKCQVMQVGDEVMASVTWDLGEIEVENTTKYQ